MLASLAQRWEAAEAKTGARLSQSQIGRAVGVATSTMNGWATGKALPRDAVLVHAPAQVLAHKAGQAAPALQM